MNRTSQSAEPAFTRKVLVTVGIVILALVLWKLAPMLMLAFGGVVMAAVIRAAAVPLARRLRLSKTIAVSIVTSLLVALVLGGGYLFRLRAGWWWRWCWCTSSTWSRSRSRISAPPHEEKT